MVQLLLVEILRNAGKNEKFNISLEFDNPESQTFVERTHSTLKKQLLKNKKEELLPEIFLLLPY